MTQFSLIQSSKLNLSVKTLQKICHYFSIQKKSVIQIIRDSHKTQERNNNLRIHLVPTRSGAVIMSLT